MLVDPQQDTRQLAVYTPLGDNKLVLRRFEGREALSLPFEYELEMLSPSDSLDPKGIVGHNVTFTVDQADSDTRYFNGFVSRFSYVDQTEQGITYRATVVPWLWLLTNTADCRIFQKKTAPQIIAEVFQDLGFGDSFSMQLHGEYARRRYCVQYRETDFAFVSRLMEEEGIYYFFRHENGKHTLVLADSISSYFDLDDAEVEFADPDQTGYLGEQITSWRHEKSFRPGRWAQTDYNFRTPRTRLMNNETSVLKLHNGHVFERYDYPGRFTERGVGRNLTRVRIEEEEAQHDIVTGHATYRSFAPAGRFSVTSHRTMAEVGRQYVVVEVKHEASVNGSYIAGTQVEEADFETQFTCIPAEVPFRPRRLTPKPIVEGPQTAVVVGPRGEEIHTDKHGRVKCQFHWDREGERDEHTSCWIRVSQIHAGKNWGSIDIPRIGEEVVVSFLEGDPDRPIIKGRVYNAEAMPPFNLPAEKTRSGGKSDTHKGSGYNEISMDDTAGAEQLRANAQHNTDTTVGNNQSLQVGVDKSEDIGNNDDTTVAVDADAEVGNNGATAVGNNTTCEVANNLVIEAGTAITLACGASTIHMNQAGVITISGQFITSAATAMNNTVAPMTSVVGSNMLTQAGLVNMKLGLAVTHINGKSSTKINAASTSVSAGTVVVKGAPIKLGEAGAPMDSVPKTGGGSGGSAGGAGGGAGSAGGAAATHAQGENETLSERVSRSESEAESAAKGEQAEDSFQSDAERASETNDVQESADTASPAEQGGQEPHHGEVGESNIGQETGADTANSEEPENTSSPEANDSTPAVSSTSDGPEQNADPSANGRATGEVESRPTTDNADGNVTTETNTGETPTPTTNGENRIPPCPETPPGNQQGDDWCRDRGSEEGGFHGGNPEWRSYGTETEGGQQCVYDREDEQGRLVTNPQTAGSIDRVGAATGEDANGDCQKDFVRNVRHGTGEVSEYLSNRERYDEIQECLREQGVPSGSPGSGEYENGITDEDHEREYRECARRVDEQRRNRESS